MSERFARGFESFDALYRCGDPHRIAVGAVRSVAELAETEWAKERGLVAEPTPGMRFPRSLCAADDGVGLDRTINP